MFRSKHGSSLVLVLIIFAFVLIIGAGAMVISSTSANQTTQSLAQKQADFTAQSVLNAVIAEIKAGMIVPDAANTIDSGYITDSNLGAYKYTIESYDSTKYQFKVSVDAWYPKFQDGSESKINSIIQGTLKTGGQFIPSSVAQTTGSNPSLVGDSFGVSNITGDLILNENGGSVSLGTTNATCTGNVYVNGSLSVDGSYTVKGDIYATKNVSITGSSRVIGNIYANGSITVGGGASVTGSKNSNFTGPTFTAASKEPWTIPAEVQPGMVNINVDLGSSGGANYTVNGDYYIINQNSYVTFQNIRWTKHVVFDATNQDLYICLANASNNGQTITLAQGLDILSNGSHNVYIFLDDVINYVNLNVASNCFVGNYSYLNGIPSVNGVPNAGNASPNLYIISDKQSEVSITSNSTFYGYIFNPNGSVTADGNGGFHNPYKLYGAVVASKLRFSSSTSYYYLSNSGGGSGGGAGTVSWTGEDCKILGTYIGN